MCKSNDRALTIAGTLIAAYVAVAIFTFGHCAKQHPFDPEGAVVSGTMAAMLWPFYWSWQAQS